MADLGMRVGMLIIVVPNLDESVVFYEKIGFVKQFHVKGQWAEFALGNVKFGICPTSSPVSDHRTGIVLEVPDMMHTYKVMQELGVEFVETPKESPHGFIASFKDPGKNIIDLYQPTPEKLQEFVNKMKAEKGDACCGEESACTDDNKESCGSDDGGCC